MASNLRSDINSALQWALALPVLAFWPLISFLPVFGLFEAEASLISVAVNLIFVATSFIGAFGAVICIRGLGGPAFRAQRDEAPKRGRAFAAAGYGAVWMTAYGAWTALA